MRVQRRLGVLVSVALTTLALGLMAGCADDLYADCQLDPNSPDPAISTCGSDDGPSRGCVVENDLACDTRACGRYQGSTPFCTKACTDDGDCPAGACREFVFQSGRKFCVADETLM